VDAPDLRQHNPESPFKTFAERISDVAGAPYHYDSDSLRAVRVAGAIGRVLLVRGAPGTGKTSLARNVAGALGWDYIEFVVTSRTQASDLLWRFDNLERLNDAYASAIDRSESVREKRNYLEPGPLFRAFAPEFAAGLRRTLPHEPPKSGVVLLMDEIDKADPDLPNDLLVPLEAKRFTIDALNLLVEAQRPVFVVVTTNEERDLPQAFLRRCVILTLKRPADRDALLTIARKHFPKLDVRLFDAVFDAYISLGEKAEGNDLRPPATAEFLDALSACEELGLKVEDEELKFAVRAALWKHGDVAAQ